MNESLKFDQKAKYHAPDQESFIARYYKLFFPHYVSFSSSFFFPFLFSLPFWSPFSAKKIELRKKYLVVPSKLSGISYYSSWVPGGKFSVNFSEINNIVGNMHKL